MNETKKTPSVFWEGVRDGIPIALGYFAVSFAFGIQALAAGLTPLEALIYTADCIEPGRKPDPGIEDSRALAETDIYAAARLCARQTVEYVRRRGGALHPRTLEMLNAEI